MARDDDEWCTLPTSLQAAFFDLVVQGEAVAEAADGCLECGCAAAGVGAVGGQDAGGQAELRELGEDRDGVGAGADGGGVELEAQTQLRVSPRGVAVRGAAVGGDGQGGAVAEGLLAGATFEVPAGGDFCRGGSEPAAVGVCADADVGGVDANVAVPAAQVAALVCHVYGGQDQAVGEELEAGGGVAALGAVPEGGAEVGVTLRQSRAPVVAGRC